MATAPSWIDALTYSAVELRRLDVLGPMHDGTALGARSGVRPGGGSLNVTLASSTITVAAGAAWVQYQSGSGMYRAVLDAAATLTLTAAHATLPRVDLVYLRVYDNSVDAGGLNQATAVYLAGTAASSPVAPTPAGTQIYIPLATISVPYSGNGSPTVNTAIRPNTVAPGGILPSSSAPSSPYTGQYYDDGSSLWRYTGTAWRPISPVTPQASAQVSQPTFSTTAAWVAFTSGQWPPIAFVVPPSGMAWISVGAALQNINTTASTGWLAWAASGGYTESPSELNGLSTSGGRTYATRRVLRTGLTPGATVTITPQWQVSSAGAPTTVTRLDNGQLSVEPVAG